MDFDFEELYQAVILDHSRKPRNFGPLPDATVTVSGDNPTCGDEIALSLKIDPAADKLEAVGFTGSGCSICMASTSLMTTKIKGKTRARGGSVAARFSGHDHRQDARGRSAEDVSATCGCSAAWRKFPQRVKCATLGWHALKGCVGGERGGEVQRGAGDEGL